MIPTDADYLAPFRIRGCAIALVVAIVFVATTSACVAWVLR